MDIRKIYEYALQREHQGKRFFLENADRLHHAAAAQAFRELAAEEQKHIEFIERQLKALDAGPSAEPVKLENTGYFSQRAASESIDQSVAEAMVPDLAVLRMAYLIEHDFVDFYEMAARRTAGDAQQTLLMLADWERTHERLFRAMHDTAFEQYAGMPWGG